MSLKPNYENAKQFGLIMNTLEDLVPQDHIVRKYEAAINWNFIYDMVGHLYSNKGKPAIDPVVLFKLVFLNYLEGIHSMRLTCEVCNVNIAYRWFLGLDLGQKIPDHSTFSQNYKRKFSREPELFNKIFEYIINVAFKNDFIDAENLFGDSTHVKASANKKKHRNKVVRETSKIYQEDLLNDINAVRSESGKKPFSNDDDDDDFGSNVIVTDELLKTSDGEDVVDVKHDDEGNIIEFSTLNEETGEITVHKSKKSYKSIKESTVDGDAGYYHKGEHEKIFAYSASAVCDSRGYILGLHVDSGNKHDSVTFFNLFNNIKNSFFFDKVKRLVLDAGYKTPAIAKTIIDNDLVPVLPYTRPKTQPGFFRKYEYVYDEMYNCYICPNDKLLKYTTTNRDGYRQYKSNPNDCKNCPFLSKCTSSKNHVKEVQRHVWEEYQEQVLDNSHTLELREIYSKRKETIERSFGDGKENHGLRFTRYRGLNRVTNSLLITFASMNLKKIARHIKLSSFCYFNVDNLSRYKQSKIKNHTLQI